MACKTPAPAPGVVVRLPTPVITPEELLADIAAQQPAPASSREALALAALTLAESLKQLLDGFPYRNNPAHPAAVWARLTALTLERCCSALQREDQVVAEIRRLLATAINQGDQSC